MISCAYCGTAPGTTRDHVPPKNLFPKPRPSNLVTVPCCESCRISQSKDDEYFVRAVVMRQDVAGHPAAERVLQAVHRSFLKPRKRGFTRALLESVKHFEVRTAAGIYLGDAASYDVDFSRLARVIGRTTRGLYLKEFSERLPDTHGCVVYALAGISADDPAVASTLRRLVQHATTTAPRVFGANVFAYWLLSIEPHATVWFHLVYGQVVFLAFTMALADIGPSGAAA